MNKAARRQGGIYWRLASLALCLLLLPALLLACSPEGGSGLGPAARSATPGPAASRPAGAPAAGTATEGSSSSRPLLLEPIVEQRPASADRALGEEDLRDLGELSILPHVIQSISTGAPCDFNDAMSTCQ